MERMDDSCESETLAKKPCCENHLISLEVENDFQPSLIQPEIDVNLDFTFVFTFIKLLNSNVEQKIAYTGYSPPLRIIEAQVLFQTFLI